MPKVALSCVALLLVLSAPGQAEEEANVLASGETELVEEAEQI